MSCTAIIVVGKSASGKTSLVGILAELGFSAYSISDQIREEARKAAVDLDVGAALMEFANGFRAANGKSAFTKILFQRVKQNRPMAVVIEGVRSLSSLNLLKRALEDESYVTAVVALDCPSEVRLQRARSRGREDLAMFAYEELQPAFSTLDTAMSAADITFCNDKSIEELRAFARSISNQLQRLRS